jgi:hypothetical protein
MDFTGLTGEEIIAASRKNTEGIIRKYYEFEEQLEQEKEQKRIEIEEWEKERGLAYEKYLQDGKYTFIF